MYLYLESYKGKEELARSVVTRKDYYKIITYH